MGRGEMPRILAWTVHLLTAGGAVFALLALLAVERQDWRAALLWLAAALAVDSVDGSLARRARVKTEAARIDGDTLDLIVDYLNYVFVPTVLIWRAGLVPLVLAPLLASLILISSLYIFARRDLKTEDHYFRGFPALWNLVAFYLFVARPGAEAGALLVAAFVALSFAPVHFVHPFRVRDYGRKLPVAALAWAAATLALLWSGWSPPARQIVFALSIILLIILMALGFARTVRGPREASQGT